MAATSSHAWAVAGLGAVTGLAILCASACGESSVEYYRDYAIDPTTLRVQPLESFGFIPPKDGRYYFRFQFQHHRELLLEIETRGANGGHTCVDDFTMDSTYVLTYRAKHQELWRGAFGLILAESRYYYAAAYDGQGTSFQTVPNANLECVEHPTFPDLTPSASGVRLDAISVVLIARSDTAFLIATANYSGAGRLQSFGAGSVAPRGDLPPDSLRAANVRITMARPPEESTDTGGWPRAFDSTAVFTSDTTWVDLGDRVPEMRLVSFHYDRNRLVREELDSAGRRVPVRWLLFERTHADSVLAGRDTTRTFGLTTWGAAEDGPARRSRPSGQR
jgi:hypothetical protein